VISGSKLFPAVNNLNVQDYFYKSFKLLPEVINTSAARALTEIWHDSRPAEQKDFILLDAGVGIGAVIVKKGVIIDWQDEYLGEFGHTIVCPGGKTCTCGLKGCLETVSSIPAIKEGAAAALGRKSITFDSVIEHYQAGDQAIMKVVDNSAEYLGLGIANLINLLVPDKIIISGSLFELGNSYICKLQRIVDESTFPLFRKKGVLMQQSIYREEAAAIGAATLSLNKFFTTFHSEKFKNKEDIRAKELAM
jgi:glucokinase